MRDRAYPNVLMQSFAYQLCDMVKGQFGLNINSYDHSGEWGINYQRYSDLRNRIYNDEALNFHTMRVQLYRIFHEGPIIG